MSMHPCDGQPEDSTQHPCATAALSWGGQPIRAPRLNPPLWNGRRVTASNCGPALALLYGRT